MSDKMSPDFLHHENQSATPSLSIFADRANVRGQLLDDAGAAGYHVAEASDIHALIEHARPLTDIVILDCPGQSDEESVATAQLDVRAADSGTQVIVSTCAERLEDVFSSMARSSPRILIDPSRVERMIALGEASIHGQRAVHEAIDESRMILLRLSDQVSQIARQVDGISSQPSAIPLPPAQNTFSSRTSYRKGSVLDLVSMLSRFNENSTTLAKAYRDDDASQQLPDARLVRWAIRQRQLRARFLDESLFADPAWDMLLDLTAAAAESNNVSVTSLCIASGVPPTTALRWVKQLTEAGLLSRTEDPRDGRRAFVSLTPRARAAMLGYFVEVCNQAAAA